MPLRILSRPLPRWSVAQQIDVAQSGRDRILNVTALRALGRPDFDGASGRGDISGRIMLDCWMLQAHPDKDA